MYPLMGATVNPDCYSLMTSSSVSDSDLRPQSSGCTHTSSSLTGTAPQEANEWPSPCPLLCVCDSAPSGCFLHPGHLHATSALSLSTALPSGWVTQASHHPLPRLFLQPIHMQLAADKNWMVLHVVWASMKETDSYRSGRQQGWLLTLRRGIEPFSSSVFSARS